MEHSHDQEGYGDYGDPADLEDADIVVERPAGAVISVRFNADELAALRTALDEFGIQMTSTFIKAAVFEAISARRRHAAHEAALRSAIGSEEASFRYAVGYQTPLITGADDAFEIESPITATTH